MTLEEIKEAVEVIKAYRQMLTDSVSNQIDEDIKAFDVAVKAMEREACGDAISRQAVLDGIADLKKSPWFNDDTNMAKSIRKEAVEIVEELCVKQLPSAQPKTGHWIDLFGGCECSECGCSEAGYSDYCPNCGARMVEPQERSEE